MSKGKLHLHNTMTRSKEPFKTISGDKDVGMYNCGPTVYNYQHIGNLRSYVFADILRRTLEADGYNVKQVINITDVGHLVSDGDTGQDKMTKGLHREGLPVTLDGMKQLGNKYAEVFKADLEKLHIQKPAAFPKASDYIKEDIAFVEILENKEFTYNTDDGVYFDTSKLDNYGKLSGDAVDDDELQQRVENNQKRNPRDFALWKFDNKLGWDSPWGQGFPGWHIECSVMGMQHLGESFDIHTGGIDHINVHHTNEIAQSESATGKDMARFWLHNNFINIEGEKISKSIGNTVYLGDLVDQGYDPLSYRYLLLSARYRTKMSFSWESLDSAQNALQRLYNFMRNHPDQGGDVVASYCDNFMSAMHDDLNTPEALSVVWKLLDDKDINNADKVSTLLELDTILGLGLSSPPEINIPETVLVLAAKRQQARENNDYEKADEIRKEITAAGYTVNDTGDGYEVIPE
jgi:cysteinyl-tRNA synthetase